MASLLSRFPRTRPMVGSAAVLILAATMTTPKQQLLDSAQNAPTKMLSMPSGMLFSKQLTVQSSEQINHDTKKITFTLPEGSSQISGVPAGCMYAPSPTKHAGTDSLYQLPYSLNILLPMAGSPSSDPTPQSPIQRTAARCSCL